MTCFLSSIDWTLHWESHRLCGDRHNSGRPGRGGDNHHTEHHLSVCLSSCLWAQPALHRSHLRSWFRFLQKHLPRGNYYLVYHARFIASSWLNERFNISFLPFISITLNQINGLFDWQCRATRQTRLGLMFWLSRRKKLQNGRTPMVTWTDSRPMACWWCTPRADSQRSRSLAFGERSLFVGMFTRCVRPARHRPPANWSEARRIHF